MAGRIRTVTERYCRWTLWGTPAHWLEKMAKRGELCNSCSTSTIMPTHGLFLSILVLHFNAVTYITVISVWSLLSCCCYNRGTLENYMLMSIKGRYQEYWLLIYQTEGYRRKCNYQCCIHLPPGDIINIAFWPNIIGFTEKELNCPVEVHFNSSFILRGGGVSHSHTHTHFILLQVQNFCYACWKTLLKE